MFSLDVVDTDKFLDMSVSAQALYFHLGMRADDDGFVSSPKKIAKSSNCGLDDLKLLAAKGFVIPFESGVVVVSHWKENNYVRADRYKPTRYVKEAEMLEEIDGEYHLKSYCLPSDNQVATNCLPSDNQLSPNCPTQVRYKDLTEGYLKADENIRKAFKIPKGAEETINILERVIEQREFNKIVDPVVLERMQYVRPYSEVSKIINAVKERYPVREDTFQMFKMFQFGYVYGKREERKKKKVGKCDLKP